MNADKKNPLVGALLCFTCAAYVIGAPIVALRLDSFVPVWLGLLILFATWMVIIGVDQIIDARRQNRSRDQ